MLRFSGGLNRRCRRHQMPVVVRRINGRRVLATGVAAVALASGIAACGSVQNMMPDPANFRLPDRSTFLPSNSSALPRSVSADGPVGATDLIDGQGQCAVAAPTASDAAPAPSRGIRLEMTECEVVRALGPPQTVDLSPQVDGQRRAIL